MEKEYVEETIEALKASPMFNLSLSSKELFHSNFLAWLADRYPENFVNILINLGIPKNRLSWGDDFCQHHCAEDAKNVENSKIWYTVEREYKKFDLCILKHLKKGNAKNAKELPVLILENKVKSIANLYQLEEYVDKAEGMYNAKANSKEEDKSNICFILLSLADVSDEIKANAIIKDKATDDNKKWYNVSYQDLITQIRSCFFKECNSFPYKAEDIAKSVYPDNLIKDYCNFTHYLILLKDMWLPQKPEDKIILSNHDEKMEDLRINDIRQKVIYSYLREKLYAQLKSEFSVLSIAPNDLRQILTLKEEQNKKSKKRILNIPDKLKDSDKPLIILNCDYGFCGALVEVKFKLKGTNNENGFICVIQIENACYKRGVIFKDVPNKDFDESKYKYLSKKVPFPSEKYELKTDSPIEKKLEPIKNKVYKYAPYFFYENRKIKEDVTVQEIVSLVVADIKSYDKDNICPTSCYLRKWESQANRNDKNLK